MSKKLIEKQVDYIYLHYETLSSIKSKIDFLISEYGEDAVIRIIEDRYGDYDVNVYAKVLETDQEYQDRIKKEKRAEEYQQEQERLQYERLRMKFEKEENK